MVLLGVMNGDMILDDTWQNRCRVAQGSCLIRIQLRNPCHGVLLPVVLAKTCLRRNMANAAHFTPTGPTISSGCSGATYAAHLARQHQKAAPVPAHTCGLRCERSTAGYSALGTAESRTHGHRFFRKHKRYGVYSHRFHLSALTVTV